LWLYLPVRSICHCIYINEQSSGVLLSPSLVLTLSVDMIYTGLINLSFTGNVCVHSNITAHLHCCLPILQNSSSCSLFDIKTFLVVLCAVSLFPYSRNLSLIIFKPSVLVQKVQYYHKCKQQPNMSVIRRHLFTFFK